MPLNKEKKKELKNDIEKFQLKDRIFVEMETCNEVVMEI